ncbi:MAG: hypothetical protein CXT71_07535 [Methanobacteriota archaeon]|jgi:hypothetical protein|nr:hypothetical protein [Euryarchaeota archaeon]RZD37868.1 MAG: hypothetical protein CXT71_07535 [Euryarchaeota archaeon]|tara:strand:+ start:3377 stop:3745 length:369 start_codon:yes stop_codon:yes gene_type:complete
MDEEIGIAADIKKEKGILVVDAELTNNGTLPLEDIKMCVSFDSSEFAARGGKCTDMGYLFPGNMQSHTFTLEPRHLVEDSQLKVRVRGRILDSRIFQEIDLGYVNMKVAKKSYQRTHIDWFE